MMSTADVLDNPSVSRSNTRVQAVVRQQTLDTVTVDVKGAQYEIHSNLRVFSRAINALSRVAEDVFFETSEDGLSIEAFNRTRSAYGAFRFSPAFFNESDTSLLNKEEANVCRLSMKSALMMLKGVHFPEKNYVSCSFNVDPSSDLMRVHILLNYDVSRTVEVKLLENLGPIQRPSLNKDSVLGAVIEQLHNESEELTISAKQNVFQLKNYQTNNVPIANLSINDTRGSKKPIKTETSLSLDKFVKHQVGCPTEITFSFREFAALVSFADCHMSVISMYYDRPGRPMIVSIESHAHFTVDFMLGTNDDDDEDVDNGLPIDDVVRVVKDKKIREEPKTRRRGPPKKTARNPDDVASQENVQPRVFASQVVDAPNPNVPPTTPIVVVQVASASGAAKPMGNGEGDKSMTRKVIPCPSGTRSERTLRPPPESTPSPRRALSSQSAAQKTMHGRGRKPEPAAKRVETELVAAAPEDNENVTEEDVQPVHAPVVVLSDEDDDMDRMGVQAMDHEEELPPTPPPFEAPKDTQKSTKRTSSKRKTPSESRFHTDSRPKRNKKLRRVLMGVQNEGGDWTATQHMSQQFADDWPLADDSDSEERRRPSNQ